MPIKRKLKTNKQGYITDVATLAIRVAERLDTPDVVYCHAFITDLLKDMAKDLMAGLPRNIQGFCTIAPMDNSRFMVAGMKLKREYVFKAIPHRDLNATVKKIEVAHDRDKKRNNGKSPSRRVRANPLAK